MRIAILYDVIYPWSIGGGEKIIWELAVRLAARGHQVDILSSKMWDGPREMHRDGVRCIGICPWLKRTNNLGNRALVQPLLFAASAMSHLASAKYDVVVCNAFPYLSCFAARLVTLLRGMPLAFTWYEARGFEAWKNYAGTAIGFCAALLEQMTSRLCRYNSTISPFTAHRMHDLLGIPRSRIVVIPCGVDCRILADSREVATPAILYVGRLVRHKRVDLLIEAFALLASDYPDLKLKIVGPGAELANLRARAEELGVLQRTEFLGSLVGESLHEQYQRSSVFVLPSELEGFGMVLIEAMAAGIPVVVRSSKHSAASTVVTDGENALIFEDLAGLVLSIRRILNDKTLRRKLIDGGHRAAERYDWDRVIVPQFEGWLRDVVVCNRGSDRGIKEELS